MKGSWGVPGVLADQDKFVGCASLQQFSDAPGKAERGAKSLQLPVQPEDDP